MTDVAAPGSESIGKPRGRMSVEDLIDSTPITASQWLIISLCALLSMLDGFDVQAIAFAAPEIRRDWGVSTAAFGPIFSIGLLGAMIGGFGIGPLSDRFGPKRILVLSTLIFSAATLATVLARDLASLAVLRAIAGLGLGAAIPAIVATLSAYAPRRVRATLVTGAFCVQLLGAVVGSLASAELMARFGWQSVFYLGGLLPLVLLPLVIWRIPEPLPFLLASGNGPARIRAALIRIGKDDRSDLWLEPDTAQIKQQKNSAVALFRDNRALATILLMTTSMVGGTFFFFLANWLPSILRDQGETLRIAVLGSTALNFGGLLGAITFAWLMDRYGPYKVMTIGYLVGGAFVMAIALANAPIAVVLGLILIAAFFGLGAQFCIPAAVVLLYPSNLRGAGIGFALGFARIGAVVGPLIGSYILLAGGVASDLFLFASICALGAAVSVYLAYRLELKGKTRAG